MQSAASTYLHDETLHGQPSSGRQDATGAGTLHDARASSSEQQPPPPALPPELLAALAMEPDDPQTSQASAAGRKGRTGRLTQQEGDGDLTLLRKGRYMTAMATEHHKRANLSHRYILGTGPSSLGQHSRFLVGVAGERNAKRSAVDLPSQPQRTAIRKAASTESLKSQAAASAASAVAVEVEERERMPRVGRVNIISRKDTVLAERHHVRSRAANSRSIQEMKAIFRAFSARINKGKQQQENYHPNTPRMSYDASARDERSPQQPRHRYLQRNPSTGSTLSGHTSRHRHVGSPEIHATTLAPDEHLHQMNELELSGDERAVQPFHSRKPRYHSRAPDDLHDYSKRETSAYPTYPGLSVASALVSLAPPSQQPLSARSTASFIEFGDEDASAESARASGQPSQDKFVKTGESSRQSCRTGTLVRVRSYSESHIATSRLQADIQPDSEPRLSRNNAPGLGAHSESIDQIVALAATHSQSSLQILDTDSSLHSSTSLKFSQRDLYLSRKDLIEKFLFSAVTEDDLPFRSTFLTIYRAFASPLEILSAMVDRLVALEASVAHEELLVRFSQMQLCNALVRWMEAFPGDFSSPSAIVEVDGLIGRLYANASVQHYAFELERLARIAAASLDPDGAWSLKSVIDSTTKLKVVDKLLPFVSDERRPSLVPSLISTHSSTTDKSISSGLSRSKGDLLSPITPTETTLESKSDSSAQPSRAHAGVEEAVAARRPHSHESVERPVQLEDSASSASDRARVAARHKHLIELSSNVSETSASLLASQITRIVWKSFVTIRPRDLLCHVLAPKNEGSTPELSNTISTAITKMINFGNYLSNWTATLILVQGRPKARLAATAHMVRLALSLRELDNFDSLMAILLGLNSPPVQRLNEISEISPDLHKKFRSLNRLMSSSRAFAAYRLAIANAGPSMIPYIGVHLQDITRLNDGKADTKDGLINWTKMRQIAGRCAVVERPYPIDPHFANDIGASRLITKQPVYNLDDDDILYGLSFAHKPRQAAKGTPGVPPNQLTMNPSRFKWLFMDTIV